jgi:hypothetical protein
MSPQRSVVPRLAHKSVVPRLARPISPQKPVVPGLALDDSGVDNVHVFASVENLGNAPADDFTVRLFCSLDDQTMHGVATTTILSLQPGDVEEVSFLADGLVGLTGENRYRVIGA